MEPLERIEDGVPIQKVVHFLEVGLHEEEEGAAIGGREEVVADQEEVGEG